MKANFNEHCVSKPASSCSVRAAEGTSHLRLLTQKNAVAGRSYQAFLCHSNRAPLVSCKNYSLFHGDDWLLWVGSDGISWSGGRWCWEVSQPHPIPRGGGTCLGPQRCDLVCEGLPGMRHTHLKCHEAGSLSVSPPDPAGVCWMSLG